MKNAKQLFNALPQNEQLLLIETVMPMSGTYRQLENRSYWSDDLWMLLANEFINSIDWEQGLLMEEIDIHDKMYVINGESCLGNKYEAVGNYSAGELVSIEDLQIETTQAD